MPDKDIMALIKKREEALPSDVILPVEQDGAQGFIGSMQRLAGGWRELADLYDRAKLKGATTTYIVPLRHAAAELDKVIKALNQPRATTTALHIERCPGCRPGVGTAPTEPHDWICGPGETTARCLGRPAPADLRGLDALIADAKAEGRGTLRTEAAAADPFASAEEIAAARPATGEEVAAYLKGAAADIPGTPALAPGSVRSLADLRAAAWAENATGVHGPAAAALEVALDAIDTTMLSASAPAPPEDTQADIDVPHEESATVQPIAPPPFTGGVISPRPIVPESWANTTTTPDGHRITGAPIPPTPLLGQPGDAGSGYSPTYVPPGGVPMTYAELMTAVPPAVLPPHISHSQIGTVGECPTKYRASRLGRTSDANGAPFFEPITQIPEWAQIGGHAVHAFIEGWERSVVEGHGRTLAADGFTEADARYEWEIAFGREIDLTESTSPVPRSSWRASKQGAEGETWWNANGPLMLKRYVDARPAEPTWNAPRDDSAGFELALELERTVDVPTPYGPVPYRAVLDRVVVRDGGPGNSWITLIIQDYKSGDRMPEDTSQLGEYAQTLRLMGVPPQVKILGTFFNARKGTWTAPVDLEAVGWTADWFVHHVSSGYAARLALTTGPTPIRTSSYCGGCPVRWACPVKGVKQ